MGIGVTLLPLDAATARAAPGGADRDEGAVPLYKALYDMRFPASRVFGEHMAARGTPIVGLTNGDMTSLWFDNLYHQWKEKPAAIAGLTARGPLFCLEQLAWERGMRVVFRAQHSLVHDGSILHEIEGANVVVEALQHVAADAWWPTGLSDVIGYYTNTGGTRSRARVRTMSSAVEVPEDEMLFSWVIAPKVRS